MSDLIREERVSIAGAVSIGATVSYPENAAPSPAVVLIMGTGKTNRDGNQRGFHTDFYRSLAHEFTRQGFVCLRYDKRGTYETGGQYTTAGLTDLTADALSVVRYAKGLPLVNSEKVLLCGHSEGAMIATLASAQEALAGLLLLGGAAMSLKGALDYQNRRLAEEAKAKKGPLGNLLRRQAASNKVDALFQTCAETQKDRVFFKGARLNAKWIREHGAYTAEDFVSLLSAFPNPVLAITGTADLSADYRCLDALAGLPHIQTYAPQGVNHMLRLVDDSNSMLTVQKQYKRLAKAPIPPETEQVIRAWLRQFQDK